MLVSKRIFSQTGFAAFTKGVQLISQSPYAKTEQLSKLAPNLDLGGKGEDIAYPLNTH